MPQARDEAGNIWEIDAAGNPVRLISQGGQAAPSVVAPNPAKVAGSQQQLRGQDLGNQRDASTLPYAGPKAAAELTRTQQEIGDRDNTRSDKLRSDFIGDQRVKEYTAVLPQLMAGLGSAPNAQGDNALIYAYAKIMDPGSAVREAEGESAANTAGFWDAKVEQIKKNFGFDNARGLPPQAAQGLRDEMNRKVAALAKSYGVARADYQDRAKRQGVPVEDVVGRSPAAGFERQYQQIMGDRLRDQATSIPGGAGGNGPDQIDPTGGNPLLSPDDRDYLSKNARYMDAQGIRNWFADRKLAVPDSEIDQTLAYYKGGGGQNATVNAPQGEGSAFGRVAAGPVGAYFGGALNGALLGSTDEIGGGVAALAGGDYAATRDALNARKQALGDANPISNTLGNVTGGLAALAAPGAALSRLGIGGAAEATALAPRLLAEDALYGAAYGAGENNQNRLIGGVTGALEGAGGGVLGRGATRVVGGAMRGMRGDLSDAVRYLREQGVPMTIPQMVGGRLKSREDRLMGFQGIGNRIADQRKAGMEGFNRAAWNQVYNTAGEVPPGVIGEEGVDAFKVARDRLYDDALNGKSFDLGSDPQFGQDVQGAWQLGSKIPDRMGKEFTHTVDLASSNIDNGLLSGKGLQAALKRLRGDRSSFASDPRGGDFGDAVGLVENAFTNAVGRADPSVIPALEKANRFYREGGILKDATGAARNTGLGAFTPAQLTNAAEKNARKYGGTESSTSRPFFDLSRAAQEILPSTVPDSGTAGRSATGFTRDLAREAINAPMYAELVRKLAQPLLLDRPDQMVRAGDIIVNRARFPGLFGSVGAMQYGQ
jgi:hypothetical protein